jgi:hypothetical protein
LREAIRRRAAAKAQRARFAPRERTALPRDPRLLHRALRALLERTASLDATRRAGAACVLLAAFLSPEVVPVVHVFLVLREHTV